jgi:GntR family transcriptional repressor for pyruvate dehydrogenase complex
LDPEPAILSSLPQTPDFTTTGKAASGPAVRMVVEALSTRLASGEYPRGGRLPAERQLAASLRVARNTLREALEILESRGLIQRRAGAGSYVAEPEPWNDAVPVAAATGPLHLHVTRGILEPEIVRLAILNMPASGLDALVRLLEEMRSTNDPALFNRAEEDFQQKLAEGTGNPLLTSCYNLVVKARRQHHRAAMLRRLTTPERMEYQCRAHAVLLNALASRDIAAATDLVQRMLIEEQRLLMQED